MEELRIKNGTKIYLYDEKKEHVAPSIYNDSIFNEPKITTKIFNDKYTLKQTILKDRSTTTEDILKNCLIYDLETFTDAEYNTVAYCLCLYGYHKGKELTEKFYGLDCIDKFIEYLNENILVKISNNKTRYTDKIDYVRIYGFNNSRFDNLFIYKKLYYNDKGTNYIFSGSSIKYIEYNNITFYDIALIYSGVSLRDLAKDMKIENQKGIFPYDFVKIDNIYYNGEFPDKKYFNEDDFKLFTMKLYDLHAIAQDDYTLIILKL